MIQSICPDPVIELVFEILRVIDLGVFVRSITVPAGFDCSIGVIQKAPDSVMIHTESHLSCKNLFV